MLYLGRLNRSDCLHILSNYEQFFKEIEKSAKDDETRLKISSTRRVWELYYPLVCLTAQATVNISEEEWLTRAREFGQAFVDAYQAEDVTTYIHIFVFHFGFFLDKYNGLEKFANYALEGKHSVIKRILAYGSSGFGYGPSETARQELCALLRNEIHQDITALTPAHERSWAAAALTDEPSIHKYVVSSKYI